MEAALVELDDFDSIGFKLVTSDKKSLDSFKKLREIRIAFPSDLIKITDFREFLDALNHVTVVHDPDENDVSPFTFLISAAQKLDDVPFLRTEIKESLEGILMSANAAIYSYSRENGKGTAQERAIPKFIIEPAIMKTSHLATVSSEVLLEEKRVAISPRAVIESTPIDTTTPLMTAIIGNAILASDEQSASVNIIVEHLKEFKIYNDKFSQSQWKEIITDYLIERDCFVSVGNDWQIDEKSIVGFEEDMSDGWNSRFSISMFDDVQEVFSPPAAPTKKRAASKPKAPVMGKKIDGPRKDGDYFTLQKAPNGPTGEDWKQLMIIESLSSHPENTLSLREIKKYVRKTYDFSLDEKNNKIDIKLAELVKDGEIGLYKGEYYLHPIDLEIEIVPKIAKKGLEMNESDEIVSEEEDDKGEVVVSKLKKDSIASTSKRRIDSNSTSPQPNSTTASSTPARAGVRNSSRLSGVIAPVIELDDSRPKKKIRIEIESEGEIEMDQTEKPDKEAVKEVQPAEENVGEMEIDQEPILGLENAEEEQLRIKPDEPKMEAGNQQTPAIAPKEEEEELEIQKDQDKKPEIKEEIDGKPIKQELEMVVETPPIVEEQKPVLKLEESVKDEIRN